MATKPSRDDTPPDPFAGPFSQSVRDSAQQIWLAGLGAFSKAQQEGGKLFETLLTSSPA